MTGLSGNDYPSARRSASADALHGRTVPDPYRWLEDPESPETKEWVASQDPVARSYLDGIDARHRFRSRLAELLDIGAVTAPVWRRGRAFFTRRGPGQEHEVLYVREPDGSERTLVDPAALSPDATVTLDRWWPSIEGERLAYQLSEGGDEEASLFVLDVATGDAVDSPVPLVRYCDVGWLPGGAEMIYGRRIGDRFDRRVWRRRLGDPPIEDVLMFGEDRESTEYHGLHVSRDGRWLTLDASLGTAPRNDLYLFDLTDAPSVVWGVGDGPHAVTVQEGVDASSIGGVRDGKLWLHTDRDAPMGRIVTADPLAPGEWSDIVREAGDSVISHWALTASRIVVVRTHGAVSTATVHDRSSGQLVATVDLPSPGSVTAVTSDPDGNETAWLAYTDFSTPPCVFEVDTLTGTANIWEAAPGAGDLSVATRIETVISDDGTRLPLFVLSPAAGASGTGPRPTILYGYGGFNVAMTPAFMANALAWVEAGGVWAVAVLRGGSEFGEEWHRAGMRENKQNVFDDFAACARRLIETGVTSPAHLGVWGGSNGGLLVGATVTQHPELGAAAMCSAPLLDMLRYEHSGYGVTWNDEYGSVSDPEEIGWLLGYSPYHHVDAGVAYPAVLFVAFDADTRVDPCHARKMCAALQWATASARTERPVIHRREEHVGHGTRSVGRMADLGADQLAFMAAQLGLGQRRPDC